MFSLKKLLLASIIGLCSIPPIYADGIPVTDTDVVTSAPVLYTDGDTISLADMRTKFKDSPSTLAYIDTLKPGIHANSAMLSIIDLNLTAARNADLEASAEGRSATKDDIERHKEYILKSQAVQNEKNREYSSQIDSISEGSHSSTLSTTLGDVRNEVEIVSDLVSTTLPIIIVLGGMMFLYRVVSRN